MVSDLKNQFYAHIDSLKKTVYSELTRKKYFTVSPDKVRQLYAAAGIVTAIAVTLLIALLFGDSAGGIRPFLAGILCGLPIFGFAKFMPAKTRAGADAYMNILGFEEFLSRAEKDQLLRMKDENLFSKFFPYALALNVADNWAKAFEGIYQQPPEWYVSPTGGRMFSPRGFAIPSIPRCQTCQRPCTRPLEAAGPGRWFFRRRRVLRRRLRRGGGGSW
jgi:hypothetical protein